MYCLTLEIASGGDVFLLFYVTFSGSGHCWLRTV